VIAASPATGWYVYGVVDAAAESLDDAVSAQAGVGSGELQIVRAGPLGAVVGAVPLDEFGDDALHDRLNDRQWLEEKARLHEAVLQAVVERTPVVPLRFGAIYHDLTDVSALLEERRDRFQSSLDFVRGRVEIGVKGWAERGRVESALERESGRDRAATPSGRAYLEQRRGEIASREQASTEIREAALAAHERLCALAVAAVANRPQPRELTGRDDEMILNAAYLVARDDTCLVDEVAALDAAFRSRGITFEVTGPWPPHNFVEGAESD
jgi:hypothetical protein